MAAPRTAGVSPARACAYAVVRRVFEQGAYADRALVAEAAGLDPRERAFATALAYGTVQRRATLDHVLSQLSDRPPARLDPPLLAALRLGLMQLLLLDGVADHAAVHESVELAKRDARAGSGLVNAILRRAIRDGPAILAGLDDATPERAAVLHSVPEWLARLWWSELGEQRTRRLLAVVNRPAEAALRVNTLISTADQVRAEIGIECHPAPGINEGLVLGAPFDVHGSELFARGAVMAQSRGSMAVARALAPEPGQRVLDLCAAPGGKTTHLAALMGDQGTLVAVERHPARARALERTLERMRVTCAAVVVADARELAPTGAAGGGGGYDRVLVDPPCSGLGTLQSRPDLRWRTSPERIAELAPVQAAILRAGADATAPGGRLVYSVCTISRAESEGVVDAFLAERDDFEALAPGWTRTAPDLDGTDGFFVAGLRRFR
jgi:16S rRNA (cytosine967-C5)-methyltransferase